MSTIMSKFNNVPNYNNPSTLTDDFNKRYGTQLTIKSGPFNFNYLKKYMTILSHKDAFDNASNEVFNEIKERIRKITGLQFKTMRLILHQFVPGIPHLLRSYCERFYDGIIRIVVLVLFDNGDAALIQFAHNLSNKEQDMFRAFIFNNDAVHKATEDERMVAVNLCDVFDAEYLATMVVRSRADKNVAALVAKRDEHAAYSDGLVAKFPKHMCYVLFKKELFLFE
jgi:hypothetical protein